MVAWHNSHGRASSFETFVNCGDSYIPSVLIYVNISFLRSLERGDDDAHVRVHRT